MNLIQIGVTKRDKHPVYIVNGTTVAEVNATNVVDSNGKTWKTQHTHYNNYRIGDNIFITHVHGTSANGMCLHSKEASIVFNEVSV